MGWILVLIVICSFCIINAVSAAEYENVTLKSGYYDAVIVELGKADDVYANPIHPYTKSLLTAIPQPDPNFKHKKFHTVYNKAGIDYEQCEWIEVKPGHFVLATEELLNKWCGQE